MLLTSVESVVTVSATLDVDNSHLLCFCPDQSGLRSIKFIDLLKESSFYFIDFSMFSLTVIYSDLISFLLLTFDITYFFF